MIKILGMLGIKILKFKITLHGGFFFALCLKFVMQLFNFGTFFYL